MRNHGMIGFLTDYGTRDGFAAVCHGVIADIAPDVRVLDISHQVPPHDVRHGGRVLARVVEYLPPTIYLGVVDPGVGTDRRGVVLRAGDNLLVGPDNGLLPPAADILGGITEARSLTNTELWLPTVDPTFHGRDIFAPVAAHLAIGRELADVGEPIAADDVVRLPEPVCEFDGSVLTAEVTYIDHFGNVQLAPDGTYRDSLASKGDVVELRRARKGKRNGLAKVVEAFGDVAPGEVLLYVDSDGRLALAVNSGSAAEVLGLVGGDIVTLVADT